MIAYNATSCRPRPVITSAWSILGLLRTETITEQSFATTCSRTSPKIASSAVTSLQCTAFASCALPVAPHKWHMARWSTAHIPRLTGGMREQNSDSIATSDVKLSTVADGYAPAIFTRCCTQKRTTCDGSLSSDKETSSAYPVWPDLGVYSSLSLSYHDLVPLPGLQQKSEAVFHIAQ